MFGSHRAKGPRKYSKRALKMVIAEGGAKRSLVERLYLRMPLGNSFKVRRESYEI